MICTLCDREDNDPEVMKTWHEGEYGMECPDHPVDAEVSDRSPAVLLDVVQEMESAVHVRLKDVINVVSASIALAEEDGVTYATAGLIALREKLGRLDTTIVKR